MIDEDVAEDGAAFLVMELLEGRGVEDLWHAHDRQLPAEIVLGIAFQVLDCLAAAHAKEIVHRDIKPANLFLVREGAVKLLDFGVARLRETSMNLNATTTGAVLGTPAFMAPEQARAELTQIDALTDVWSVGATMFTLLSGGLVHDAPNGQQVVIYAATRPSPSLATAAPQVDRRVVALVDRALMADKASRWPSAVAMRDAIAALHQEMSGAAPTAATLGSFLAATDRRALEPLDSGARARLATDAHSGVGSAATLASHPPMPPSEVGVILREESAGVRAPSEIVATSQPVSSGTARAERPRRARSAAVLVAISFAGLGAIALAIELASSHQRPPPYVAASSSIVISPPVASALASDTRPSPDAAAPLPPPTGAAVPVAPSKAAVRPASHARPAGPVAPSPAFDPASVR